MSNVYNSQAIQQDSGLKGYLFLPPGEQQCGAVIIIHERYGLLQHTFDLANKLSDAGLVAFAPDLFFGHYEDEEAVKRGDERVSLTDTDAFDALDRSIDYLMKQERIDPQKIVVMGVCQSGRYPIVVNSRRHDIAANVIFYGAAHALNWDLSETNDESMEDMIRKLDAPSFFVFGEKDHVISYDEILRLRSCLELSNKSYRMKIYADGPHGFLNDTMPGRYRHEMAQDAWSLLLTFLDEVFNGRWSKDAVQWEFISCISKDYDFSKHVRYT